MSSGKKVGTATNSPAPGCSSSSLWLNNSETPKIDINTATVDDLETLTGVGRAKAEAIIDIRKSIGGFTCLEDLTRVPGVGTNVLDLNRIHLTCSSNIGAFSSSSITPTTCSTSSSCVLNSATCTCGAGTCSLVSQPTNSSCKVENNNRDSISRSRPRRRESLRELKSGNSSDQGEQIDPLLPGPSQSNSLEKESSTEETCEPHATSCHHHNNSATQSTSVHSCCSESKHNVGTSTDAENNTKETNPSQTTPVRKLRSSCADRHSCRAECDAIDSGDRMEDQPSDCQSDNEMDASSEHSEEEEEQEPMYMYGLEDSLQECSVAEDDGLCRNGQEGKDLASGDKMVMKRKSDGNSDGRGHLPGKKPCRTPERISGSSPSDANSAVENGASEAEMSSSSNKNTSHPMRLTGAIAKKQFPTKINPPPELEEWLNMFQSWNNGERLLALNHLIDTCEPSQVRHMMNVIEPQFQRDFISLLPKELALYVLSFLEPRDLLRAAQTCRYWRILAEDNLLWREKCREAGIDFVREVLGKRRIRSNSNGGSVYNVGGTIQPSPWKAAYMRHHNIEMNWRSRPIRPPKVLKGHDDHVITCLQFSGNRIVSGSDDNTLKVWSATTGKCLRTLVGHTGGVWSSQMSGNLIISGSTDRTLKVWNADTGLCVHTLYGHTSTVRCMHLHGHKVVSGSRDATLRLWDIDFGECLHVLVGHVAAVRCVQYNGKLVVSGAYDYMVKVWNPEREECLHTLQGHTNRVYSLQFDGVHVVSGSLDTSIRVWDVETGACKHTLMGHQSLTSGMELRNNILVSGNADSTVKVWDILTGQCLQTLAGPNKHQSAVTCLQFNNKFVITSSDDGTVKLWDLKTGEFVRNLVALESGGSGGVVWRIRASPTKLVCAVGSRNGTEETKLLVLDFDAETK